MKNLLLILLINITFLANAQKIGIGVGLAYSSRNAINLELIGSGGKNNNYKIGFTYQFSGVKGELVEDQLSNHGRKEDGRGRYFYSIDLGYGKTINKKFHIDGELSFGSWKYYTNYIDNRFSNDRYHMITDNKFTIGIGINAGYVINEKVGLICGVSTLRKLQFGIRLLF